MFKLRPRYYGAWFGLLFGVILVLSAVAQQYKATTEQKQSLVNIRAELKEYMQARLKEVPVEQVKIDARQFLQMKVNENPSLKDQIHADVGGLSTTQEQSRLYSAFFMSGIVAVFGALMYLARKKQKFGGVRKWLILEIVGIVVVAQHIVIGILNNGWYYHPLFYTLIPLWIMSAYAALFFMVPIKPETEE